MREEQHKTISTDIKSTFNEAELQLLRLHNMWQKAEQIINNPTSNEREDLVRWDSILNGIWRELRPDVDRMSKPKKYLLIDVLYRHNILKAKTYNKRYRLLDERHQFLKCLQDVAGKGGKYEDASSKQFE